MFDVSKMVRGLKSVQTAQFKTVVKEDKATGEKTVLHHTGIPTTGTREALAIHVVKDRGRMISVAIPHEDLISKARELKLTACETAELLTGETSGKVYELAQSMDGVIPKVGKARSSRKSKVEKVNRVNVPAETNGTHN